jgi:hypothetical protein
MGHRKSGRGVVSTVLPGEKDSFRARKGRKMSCQNCVSLLTTCHFQGSPTALLIQYYRTKTAIL